MARLRGLLAGAVLAPVVVLAGPAAPGTASVLLPPAPLPVQLPSSALAGYGASASTVSAALAESAGSAAVLQVGTGTPVVAGGAAVSGGAAAGAAAAVTPVAVAAGGLMLGWQAGRFIGSVACSAGAEAVCWPQREGYAPNADVTPVPSGQQGFIQQPSGTWFANWHHFRAYNPYPSYVLGTATWEIVGSPPVFGQAGAQTFTLKVSTVGPSGTWQAGVQWWYYCQRTSDGSLFSGGGNLGTVSNTAPVVQATATAECGASAVFDHLAFSHSTSSSNLDELGGDHTTWWPEGHATRPGVDSDPERTWLTRGQCVRGSEVEWVTSESGTWRESQDKIPAYPSVECSSGWQLKRLEVRKLTPALDAPADDVVVWEWDYPTDDPDGLVPAQRWPECAGGTCVLRLWKVMQDGSLLDCFDAPGACADWWPRRAVSPAEYVCKYGSHEVPISECYIYRPTFGHKASVESGTLPEDPPYANPDGSLPEGEPTAPTDPGGGGGCPPDAGFLSFLNPFWLFDTLKCALVPSEAGLQAGWDSAGVDWCQTAPGALVCAVDALIGPFGEIGNGDDSCLGAGITLPNVLSDDQADDGQVHPFQACGQLATVSEWWLMFSSAAIYLGAGLAGARVLAGTIGAKDAVQP